MEICFLSGEFSEADFVSALERGSRFFLLGPVR